jgi:hypothetical protein
LILCYFGPVSDPDVPGKDSSYVLFTEQGLPRLQTAALVVLVSIFLFSGAAGLAAEFSSC